MNIGHPSNGRSVPAALINASFPARVYYMSQTGFDTHFGQKSAHPGLMTEWSQAVKAFHDDLVRLNQDHRVVMLTFSEFGRRVKENFSQGTDNRGPPQSGVPRNPASSASSSSSESSSKAGSVLRALLPGNSHVSP